MRDDRAAPNGGTGWEKRAAEPGVEKVFEMPPPVSRKPHTSFGVGFPLQESSSREERVCPRVVGKRSLVKGAPESREGRLGVRKSRRKTTNHPVQVVESPDISQGIVRISHWWLTMFVATIMNAIKSFASKQTADIRKKCW